jgi:hypothetical protein
MIISLTCFSSIETMLRAQNNGYWLLLLGGIVQSVPRTCDRLLIYFEPLFEF